MCIQLISKLIIQAQTWWWDQGTYQWVSGRSRELGAKSSDLTVRLNVQKFSQNAQNWAEKRPQNWKSVRELAQGLRVREFYEIQSPSDHTLSGPVSSSTQGFKGFAYLHQQLQTPPADSRLAFWPWKTPFLCSFKPSLILLGSPKPISLQLGEHPPYTSCFEITLENCKLTDYSPAYQLHFSNINTSSHLKISHAHNSNPPYSYPDPRGLRLIWLITVCD